MPSLLCLFNKSCPLIRNFLWLSCLCPKLKNVGLHPFQYPALISRGRRYLAWLCLCLYKCHTAKQCRRVASAYLLRSMPTCKTDKQIHEESIVKLLGWYDVPFPSSCWFHWKLTAGTQNGGGLTQCSFSWISECFSHSPSPFIHTFEEAARQQCSPGERVNDCANRWVVSQIRGPKVHLLLTRMNSLPNSSKKDFGCL